MKTIALATIIALAAAAATPHATQAAGIIAIDPVPGMPNIVRPPIIAPGHLPRPINNQPRPVLRGNVSFGLRLQSENVKVDIIDQVAKTYISQTFVNDTDQNLAGTYLFPLPEDTTFSSFSLHIDSKPVEGKILEANEARQQYEEIVRRMVDPGLLEYADYKTVRARIFPIPAHGSKKVELEYTQVLRGESGLLKYRFPLRAEEQTAATEQVKIDVKLASKQGLKTIWSPSHTVDTNKANDHLAKVAFSAKDSVPDKDFLLYYSVSDRDFAANLITHKDDSQDGYFLLTLAPPMEAKQVISKDVVLVTDTSGSMQGEKMEENKKALKYVVNALSPGDRFNIIQFNTDVDKFKANLVAATPENKKNATAFIDELEARGGTNIGDALKASAANLKQASGAVERPAYLVLLTDGEPTVGETNAVNLVKSVPGDRGIRLFDFGIGYDINTRLLNKLAESHHGSSQYVEPDESIETALSGFYRKIKSPVLTDVNIEIDGVQAKNTYPKEVKDLFAGTQAILIGRYKGSGKGVVKVTGKVNGAAKSYAFPVSFSSDETGNTYLSRLWAMRRIGYLTEVAQENHQNREVIQEIVELSKKYGIISAYTSYLLTDPNENHRAQASPPIVSFGSAGGRLMREEGRSTAAASPARSVSVAQGSLLRRQAKPQANWYSAPRQMQIDSEMPLVRDFRSAAGGGAGDALSGAAAVHAAKKSEALRQADTIARASEKDGEHGSTKSVEDKTFYLKGGFWVDSAYMDGSSPKPTQVAFGTRQYFDLIRTTPGLAKYLSVGQKVIVIFKGRAFKVVDPASSAS